RSVQSDTDFGQFAGVRLEQALGPSFIDDDGNAVCGTPGNVIAGCVPLNLFQGPGSITLEMLDYVSVALNDITRTTTEIWSGSVTGDLFDLWAGPLQAAFGVEHRRESLIFVPDSAKVLDAATGNTGFGTKGSKSVDSAFLELNFPLVAARPGMELLEIGIGSRYDDFSSFGSETSSTLGIRWKPTDNWLIRGTYSQSFREPTISNLFGGVQDSFPQTGDPCNDDSYPTLNADAQARCRAQGVPEGGYDQTDSQPRSRVGGQPDLVPEDGESFTLGFGWSPEQMLPGFSLTIDYWDIEVQNAIEAPAPQTILDGCIKGNVQAFCDNIQRFPGGRIDKVIALTDNIGLLTARGVDLEARFSHQTGIGAFTHRLLATYLMERETAAYPGAEPVEQDGRFDTLLAPRSTGGAFPRFRSVYSVDWTWGNWGASSRLESISSIVESGSKNKLFDNSEEFEIPDQLYLDLVGRYHFSTGTSVAFGINNVTDEQAPFINNGFNAETDPTTYRVLGREYFIRVTQSF
ncbi:MAG: TonB-dependent receptor, partial [Gammaproteobacteria bacterium]|nr:TonB-dependent receptor [Gammaproteobacteria bacterium]